MLFDEMENMDFYNQAKDGKVKSPDIVWDRIEASLLKRKKKRFLWIFFFVTGLLGMFFIGQFLIKDYNKYDILTSKVENRDLILSDSLCEQYLLKKLDSIFCAKERREKELAIAERVLQAGKVNNDINKSSNRQDAIYKPYVASNNRVSVFKVSSNLLLDTVSYSKGDDVDELYLYSSNKLTSNYSFLAIDTNNIYVDDSILKVVNLDTPSSNNFSIDLGVLTSVGGLRTFDGQQLNLTGKSIGLYGGLNYHFGKNVLHINGSYQLTFSKYKIDNPSFLQSDGNMQNIPGNIVPVPNPIAKEYRLLIHDFTAGFGYDRQVLETNKWSIDVGTAASILLFSNARFPSERISTIDYLTHINGQLRVGGAYKLSSKMDAYTKVNYTIGLYSPDVPFINKRNHFGVNLGFRIKL